MAVAPVLDADAGGLLTLTEAAKRVGVSRESVRLWVKRGQVETTEWAGSSWILESSLYECELARRRSSAGRKRKVNKMTPEVHRPHGRATISTGCTIQRKNGEFCDAPPAEGMPYPVCPKHVTSIYHWAYDMVLRVQREPYVNVPNRGWADGKPSWVYYALMPDGLVKIGYSAVPALRMATLGVTIHELLALEPGNQSTEHSRHSQFREFAAEGSERFRPVQALQDHVASLVKEHGPPRAVLDQARSGNVEYEYQGTPISRAGTNWVTKIRD